MILVKVLEREQDFFRKKGKSYCFWKEQKEGRQSCQPSGRGNFWLSRAFFSLSHKGNVSFFDNYFTIMVPCLDIITIHSLWYHYSFIRSIPGKVDFV